MRRFRMPSKHFLVASLVLFLFACGGGSCAGCAGCGVAPIPGGFPIAERIDNSAQVRLTNAGIGFLESNVATIASTLIGMDLEFPIPRSTTSVAVVGDLTICPDSDCRIRATIRSLDLVPTAPNRLTAQLRLDGRFELGGGLGVDPPAGHEIDPIAGGAGDDRVDGEIHGRAAVPEPLNRSECRSCGARRGACRPGTAREAPAAAGPRPYRVRASPVPP